MPNQTLPDHPETSVYPRPQDMSSIRDKLCDVPLLSDAQRGSCLLRPVRVYKSGNITTLAERYQRLKANYRPGVHILQIRGYQFATSEAGDIGLNLVLNIPTSALTLKELISTTRQDIETIRNFCAQVGDGLDFIHQLGNESSHGAVRADNIFVEVEPSPEGQRMCRLGPFSAESTPCSTSIRTYRGWMAPELIYQAGNHTPASDVYALGCTLYELFCGEAPNLPLIRTRTNLDEEIMKALPSQPTVMDSATWDTCVLMLQPIPGLRPSASKAARWLRDPNYPRVTGANISTLKCMVGRIRDYRA